MIRSDIPTATSIPASMASTTSCSTAATASPGARASTVITGIGNKAGNREPETGNSRPSRGAGSSHSRVFPFPVPRSRRFAAFTLIEMLAVIVLIAIAVTVTAVSLRGRARGQLVASAQRVAAGLRDTRTRAMATGKPQWFTVALRGHAWAAPGRDPRAFPPGASGRVTSAAEDTDQAGMARIRYFPDGSSSGGNIVLSDNRRSARVDVDWLTGAVTIAHDGASP